MPPVMTSVGAVAEAEGLVVIVSADDELRLDELEDEEDELWPADDEDKLATVDEARVEEDGLAEAGGASPGRKAKPTEAGL